MNTTLWEILTKTALLGAERAPLPEALLRQSNDLGIGPRPDEEPARTALELLAAFHLLRKAGFPLAEAAAPLPVPAPDPAAAFPAPLLPALDLILAGVYPRALDELLQLMAARTMSLPPEYLPALLDRAHRDRAFFEKIRPALGARGAWLAAQHPDWRALYAAEAVDWATGQFAERLRWLHDTRATTPLLALALLEKTWRTERPDHKRAVLQALRRRLSSLDEDFLEKIRHTEKNRDARQTALALLAQIPESQTRAELLDFFRTRLAGVFTAAAPGRFLEKQLPELDEPLIGGLVGALPAAEVKTWRTSLLALLIRLLPPAETAAAAGLPPARLLAISIENTALEAVFPAFVHASAGFRDASGLEAVVTFLVENPTLSHWAAAPAGLALDALPDTPWAEVLQRLLMHGDLLADPGSPPAAALQIARRPWPRAVLLAFLNRLIRLPGPLPHLQWLLEKAAYDGHPEDAEAARLACAEATEGPWRAELAHFFDALRFREKLRRAFHPIDLIDHIKTH